MTSSSFSPVNPEGHMTPAPVADEDYLRRHPIEADRQGAPLPADVALGGQRSNVELTSVESTALLPAESDPHLQDQVNRAREAVRASWQ